MPVEYLPVKIWAKFKQYVDLRCSNSCMYSLFSHNVMLRMRLLWSYIPWKQVRPPGSKLMILRRKLHHLLKRGAAINGILEQLSLIYSL